MDVFACICDVSKLDESPETQAGNIRYDDVIKCFLPPTSFNFSNNACIFTPPKPEGIGEPQFARVNLSHMNFFTASLLHQIPIQKGWREASEVNMIENHLRNDKDVFHPSLTKHRSYFQGNGRKENQMLMRRNQVLTASSCSGERKQNSSLKEKVQDFWNELANNSLYGRFLF